MCCCSLNLSKFVATFVKGFEYLSCLFFSPLDVDLESELDPDPLYNVYADPKHWFSAMAVCC